MSGSAERHRFTDALQTLTHAARHQPARLKREAKVEVKEMSSGSCASRTERQNKMGFCEASVNLKTNLVCLVPESTGKRSDSGTRPDLTVNGFSVLTRGR